jgi:PAS domain S-box-containing protein
MRDPDGNILRWHFAGTDIEDLKQSEQKLRQSEAYLEAQRLSHTVSWAWPPATGEITYWSEECFRPLGFDPHRGPPRIEALYESFPPEDVAKIRETLDRGIREKTMYEYDYRIIHPNGSIRDVHLVGHSIFSPTGELIESVGTVVDITERKRAQEARQTAPGTRRSRACQQG